MLDFKNVLYGLANESYDTFFLTHLLLSIKTDFALIRKLSSNNGVQVYPESYARRCP